MEPRHNQKHPDANGMTKRDKLAELRSRVSQLTPARQQQLAAEAQAAAESMCDGYAELERLAVESQHWLDEFQRRYQELNGLPKIRSDDI